MDKGRIISKAKGTAKAVGLTGLVLGYGSYFIVSRLARKAVRETKASVAFAKEVHTQCKEVINK